MAITANHISIDLASKKHKLIRLLPEQIPATWPFIVSYIEDGLMESVDGEDIALIYNNLLAGLLETWILVRKGEDENGLDADLAAVLTIQIVEDQNTGSRNLLIYTVSAEKYISSSTWDEVGMSLAEYARASNCKNIIAVSSNARIIEICKRSGANVDSRYIVMKVGA